VTVARFIQFLYYDKFSIGTFDLGDLPLWLLIRTGLSRDRSIPLPSALLEREKQRRKFYLQDFIGDYVQLYVFADKYEIPSLQKHSPRRPLQ
jgi:hypothetical protein